MGAATTVLPVFRVIGAIGRVLIGTGLVLLAFVAFQLWGTGLEESAGQDQLSESFALDVGVGDHGDPLAAVTETLATVDPATVGETAPPPVGEAAGAIVIPKIGVRKFFVEGTDKASLKKGPGHYQGTPMPGQAGNAAIAGHRTTYGAPFNRIDELVPGDRIETYTLQGKFVYEVIAPPEGEGIERGPGWWSVRPSAGEVVGALPEGGNTLTLTACHPEYSARERIIVRARLVADQSPAPAATTGETIDGNGNGDSSDGAVVPEPSDDELEGSFGGDPDALSPAIGFLAGALAALAIAWWIARRWTDRPWRRRLTYLAASPAILSLLWFCFVWTDRWLPSL